MNTQIWAEIRRLRHSEGYSISKIARGVGVDRKTVRKALNSDFTATKIKRLRPSKVDNYKEYLQNRLKEYPQMSGPALYNEICRLGYTGKIRILNEYLMQIRVRKKEVFLRIETQAGEYAQVDWANCGTAYIGAAIRKISCFVMILSYSRMMYLEFTLSQCLEDFLQCHNNAFKFFGGVPKKILYDNLKTVVLSRLGSEIRFNPKFMEFAGTYLFEPVCCNPGRGNEKGKVESGIKYIRTNFLAGTNIAWPAIKDQALVWLNQTANIKLHSTTRQRPCDLFEQEKPLLMALPDKEYDTSIIRPVKATSQALVRFDGNAYSVPYAKAYSALTLKATASEVFIFDSIHQISAHKRSYERGVVIEDPKHYDGLLAEKKKAQASKLKEQFLQLGKLAKAYLEGLVNTELNLNHHINLIMGFVRLYGKTEVLGALDYALTHRAYAADYIKNIIFQHYCPVKIPSIAGLGL